MPVNPRLAKIKSDKFSASIGSEKPKKEAKKEEALVPPWALGILLFVVIGSVVFGIIQNARNAATYGQGAVYEG